MGLRDLIFTGLKMRQSKPLLIETLAGVEVGGTAIVEGVAGDGSVSRRLMEMGIVPGVRIRVVKRAPFGDPIELRVRGYNLALRLSEAQTVRVLVETE